jgi:peptide/nickel transport system permease protein
MSIAELEAAEIAFEAPSGLWRDAMHRFVRNPGAMVGVAMISVIVLSAILAPWIRRYDPYFQNFNALHNGFPTGPSWKHWFGVDTLGRDQWARILYGARISLLIGVVTVSIGLSVGLFLGSIAGWFGGKTDAVIMRCMDIMLAIPGFLFAIGLVALLGNGLRNVIIAVGVVQIPIFARLLRGTILAQRESDYVMAARAVGVPGRNILVAHVIPNSISPVIVQATLSMATAIIDVAGLGFLGLALQDPSTPEWGSMLTNANDYLASSVFLAIIPGLAILISVLGFNLIGDGLREALDPKLRGRI